MSDDYDDAKDFLTGGDVSEEEAEKAAKRMRKREELDLEGALQEFAGDLFVRLEDAPRSERKYLYLKSEAEEFLNDFEARSIARRNGYNTEINRSRSDDEHHVITLIPK